MKESEDLPDDQEIENGRDVVKESLRIWLLVLLAAALFGFIFAVATIGNMLTSD